MYKLFLTHLIVIAGLFLFQGCSQQKIAYITPNQFEGTDTERIQAAIGKASKTTGKVIIPAINSNGSNIWLIDSAILLPGDMTVILKNCVIQLSDKCRDNMFRSDNVGIGITDPKWNHNIKIIGIGDVLLKGADNPRATGDAIKKLSLNPTKEVKKTGNYHISYGTDAGKEDIKQTGDWRNIMILMAYVDGLTIKNLTIKNTHSWSISNERVVNAEISNIRFDNPPVSIINSRKKLVRNRDGIDLWFGCKNFRIDNISGVTGDDVVALSAIIESKKSMGGTLNHRLVTLPNWSGPEDNIENIYITDINVKSHTRAIALRANAEAGIDNVYINGVVSKGGRDVILLAGRGYGPASKPGKINNIHAMNIIGNGNSSLIDIDAPIADCSFMNGVYRGNGDNIIVYNLEKNKKVTNIITRNLIKSPDQDSD